MLELVEANMGDTLYDLGSGDGRIITMAAQEFGAKAVGIEIDPIRVFWSRRVIQRRGLSQRVRVLWGNFYNQSLEEATVVTIFQSQRINNRLRNKLLQELKPGTRVISYSYPFDGWNPVKIDKEFGIYLYNI